MEGGPTNLHVCVEKTKEFMFLCGETKELIHVSDGGHKINTCVCDQNGQRKGINTVGGGGREV